MAFSSQVDGYFQEELRSIQQSGRLKAETVLNFRQGTVFETPTRRVVNLCSNDYLGLANHPDIINAVEEGLKAYGFGIASARFVCGTQSIHKELESEISEFLGMDDTILYNSCFDANNGLFGALFGQDDCIISDSLNHASIIDGIRLCKATRKLYRHSDMANLKSKLDESSQHRIRVIVTDGVFSMDGELARLLEICDLADEYAALVVVDDSHGTGLLGAAGRGTPEYSEVGTRVDIITSTLGKALGGTSGGFTSSRKAVIDLLRQKSRPYLFSNSVSPTTVVGTLKALEIIKGNPKLRQQVQENSRYFREQMVARGFEVAAGIHPVVPVVMGDEELTMKMADRLNNLGILVVGFTDPVVPKGQARIRVQVSSMHTRDQLEQAAIRFSEVAQELGQA